MLTEAYKAAKAKLIESREIAANDKEAASLGMVYNKVTGNMDPKPPPPLKFHKRTVDKSATQSSTLSTPIQRKKTEARRSPKGKKPGPVKVVYNVEAKAQTGNKKPAFEVKSKPKQPSHAVHHPVTSHYTGTIRPEGAVRSTLLGHKDNKNLNKTIRGAAPNKAHLAEPRQKKQLGPSALKRNSKDDEEASAAKKPKVNGPDAQLGQMKRKLGDDEDPRESKKLEVFALPPMEIVQEAEIPKKEAYEVGQKKSWRPASTRNINFQASKAGKRSKASAIVQPAMLKYENRDWISVSKAGSPATRSPSTASTSSKEAREGLQSTCTPDTSVEGDGEGADIKPDTAETKPAEGTTKMEGAASSKPKELDPSVPLGIKNFSRACYINAAVQALANVPLMTQHYIDMADKTIPEVDAYASREAEILQQGGSSTRANGGKRKKLRALLKENKSNLCLGAYLGCVFKGLANTSDTLVTPSSFLFAQACGAVLKNGDGRPFNGEHEEECGEFLQQLLEHLEWEELNSRTEDYTKPSLVRKLFGLKLAQGRSCRACGHIDDHKVFEESFYMNVKIPANNGQVTLEDCLETFSAPDPVDIICKQCGSHRASRAIIAQKLAPFMFVSIDRLIPRDEEKELAYVKPPKSESTKGSLQENGRDVPYKLIADIKHHSTTYHTGHWTTTRKLQGGWWLFDDHRATRVNEVMERPEDPQHTTCMVLLRRFISETPQI